ncbi:AAA+ lid domain/P-loop containing dynein motor region D4/Microtubule-binding stalk of dynein motor, putative [Angomonas deanei]|uniref:AAA+ lid domain/P-loop containing dynein motor region D4/Microtubule-binding stalk of dynein motor, putative n=1 Tax=Angomonas deanei TaxID=59799 RepID=A0A7G2CCK4_9TRYP|nr:AAA+ lid domain/P-loop containing dynein motor region D4/Microtubule-binding stalk of dynein motor, putative [Angomonas deanei]
MTPRLTSRFHLVCQPVISDESSKRIFGSILYGFFRQWNSEEITSLGMHFIEAARACYNRITTEKLPTPTRSHYTFNLRDFSKVIQGVMQASPNSAPTREALCAVFIHEVSRTFHDRLIDDEDRAWWWKTLEEVTTSKLEVQWADSFPDLRFGDFARRDRSQYEKLPELEDLQTLLADYLKGFNMEYNKESSLVFFKDAVNHIARICRILRQPRGHALLVGMGGSGRQSACKLAAFICDLPIHEVTITRTFSMTEFRETMKQTLLEGGCKDKPILFFLPDTQIVFEEMLEDINNLLNTGEIPNLMETEDVEKIIESVRPLAVEAGKEESINVIFSHFVSLCRSNVHLVLSMSPIGEQFRRRLRMFPSLVNCCSIDWFDQWPADALTSVAERILAPVETVSEDLKPALIKLCVGIHLDVQKSSEEFYEELRRRNYTTPTSYLELLNCYCSLLNEQDNYVSEQIRRYQGGLNTLKETQTTVDDMKASLVEMQPKLIEAAKQTEEIMAKVEKEQSAAAVVQKQCAEEEAVASGIQAEADGIRGECQVELDKALPILKAAETALAELRPDDIREVRSFQKPASRVVLVLEAVLVLLGEKGCELGSREAGDEQDGLHQGPPELPP